MSNQYVLEKENSSSRKSSRSDIFFEIKLSASNRSLNFQWQLGKNNFKVLHKIMKELIGFLINEGVFKNDVEILSSQVLCNLEPESVRIS